MKREIYLGRKQILGLVFFCLAVVGIAGVIAYGTSSPDVFGHSVEEVDWNQTIQGQMKSSGGFCIGSNCVNSWDSIGGGGCVHEFCERDGYFDPYTSRYYDEEMGEWVETRIWYGWGCISGGETLNLGEAPSAFSYNVRQFIFKCEDDPFLYSASDVNHVQHTAKGCTDAGGTVIDISNNKLCQFSNPVSANPPKNYCPSGWVQYKNWSETSTKTCVGVNKDGCTGKTDCSVTSMHPWSNVAPESCNYLNSELGTFWSEIGDYTACTTRQTLCTNLTKVACY